MFFNLSDDCMATDQMTINRNGWKSKKKREFFCHTMKLYNVNIYKEITFICGYYGENDLVNKVLSHVCTHLTYWFMLLEPKILPCSPSCPSALLCLTFCDLQSSYTFCWDMSFTEKHKWVKFEILKTKPVDQLFNGIMLKTVRWLLSNQLWLSA